MCLNTAQDDRNPVALANQIQAFGNSNRVLGNTSADFDLFTPLTARILVGVDRTDGNRSDYFPLASPAGAGFGGRGAAGRAHQPFQDAADRSHPPPRPSPATTASTCSALRVHDYALSEFVAEAQGLPQPTRWATMA